MMNLGVDLLGIESVASVIRQSRLPRFYILRHDMHKSSTPVFEVNDSSNVETAVKRFIEWGNTVLVGNPNNDNKYDIVMHAKDYDNLSDDDLQSSGIPKRDRVNKVSFSFMLRPPQIGSIKENPAFQNFQPAPQIAAPDYSNYIHKDEFDKKLNDALEREALKRKIDALEEKLLNRDEEEEEEETTPLMAIAGNVLSRLFPAAPVQQPINETPQAAINGTPFNDDELDRIDEAIEKMRQVDSNIIMHLEKLALMSEKNPDQFRQLISMLNAF